MIIETIILIPNFNGKRHLRECLSSLQKQTYKKFKVILIDNNSTDDSVRYTKKRFPKTEILKLNRNCGFSPAINIGVTEYTKKYGPKYIALLNNDTLVDKNWLKHLITAANREDKTIAVASNMLFYDNPEIINSQGGTFNKIGEGHDINMHKRLKEKNKIKKIIIAACGGAMLIKSKHLKKTRLFDDRYFAYVEDLDFGIRANIMGYKIIFEEKALVYHKGSATWGKFYYKKVLLCKRNALCTILKNYEIRTMIKMISFLLIDYFLFSILYPFVNIKDKQAPKKFKQKLKYMLIPFYVLRWNIKNLKETLRLRKYIQFNREIKDSEIFKLR